MSRRKKVPRYPQRDEQGNIIMMPKDLEYRPRPPKSFEEALRAVGEDPYSIALFGHRAVRQIRELDLSKPIVWRGRCSKQDAAPLPPIPPAEQQHILYPTRVGI